MSAAAARMPPQRYTKAFGHSSRRSSSLPLFSMKPRKERPVLEPIPSEDGDSKFARALASPDWNTREKGSQGLTLWLTRRTDITEAELKKIWKGLFYCFWHSDKSPVQVALAERLAGILPQMSSQGAFDYFRVFLLTMKREWFGIDRLRLDKFLMLIRKFVDQLFVHLQNSKWEAAEVERYTQLVEEEVLLVRGTNLALGLALQLADVWLPQLLAVCRDSPVPGAALGRLLLPFAHFMAHSDQPAAIARTAESVFTAVAEEQRSPSEGRPLRHLDAAALADTLFALGARSETRVRNREALYSMSKVLEQAQRKRRRADASTPSAPTALPPRNQPAAVGRAANGNGSNAAGPSGQPAVDAPAKMHTSNTVAEALDRGPQPSPTTAEHLQQKLSKIKKKRRLQDENDSAGVGEPGQAVSPANSHPAAAEAPAGTASLPSSSGSKKKRKWHAVRMGMAEPSSSKTFLALGLSQGVAPVRNGVSKPLSTPMSSMANGTRSTLKKRKQQESGMQNGEAQERKKSVRFQLRRNLYLKPNLPAEVRTPPGAQPKGSALKAQSAVVPGPSRLRPKSPKSVPRAKAALFF